MQDDVLLAGAGSVRPRLSSGSAISCQDGCPRTALPIYRTTGGGNDAHHPTVFCYTNIRPRGLEIVRSTERARRGPAGRASERQTRSDLICDRKTPCPLPPLHPPFPRHGKPSPRRRIHLLQHPLPACVPRP